MYTGRFSGNHWVSLVVGGQRNWKFRVSGNLTYREDSGLINSSPVVNIPSVIYLQHGCTYTIKIPGTRYMHAIIVMHIVLHYTVWVL